MLGHRIKLDDELMEKVKQCAAKAGYSSPEEFVIHTLEKEVTRVLSSSGSDAQNDPEEEVKKRLRGLGYID